MPNRQSAFPATVVLETRLALIQPLPNSESELLLIKWLCCIEWKKRECAHQTDPEGHHHLLDIS
jgi:hypothetical protein